jgi:hypothetical protein
LLTLLQYPFWPLLHYFVYSVTFNITTIPLFGLYFTILLILYHSTWMAQNKQNSEVETKKDVVVMLNATE